MFIGAKIRKGDAHWELLITLLNICRVVFKDTVTSLELLQLSSNIDDFLTQFKTCFPTSQITPNMHHLVHYPRYIRLFGPLNAVWCMRYEGKRSYFKQVLHILGNFINVPWTLAFRHQQSMCKKILAAKGKSLTFQVPNVKML